MLLLALKLKKLSEHCSNFDIESVSCTLQIMTSDLGWIDVYQVELDRKNFNEMGNFSISASVIRDAENALRDRWRVVMDDFDKIDYQRKESL